ncbi:MAG: DsbE family thiol:disulfide interchange protein [Betaproteobacteria bacterium]|nr:DsbE family thiol:disulfide interchange protein [Betaproteobacteria bacterium]
MKKALIPLALFLVIAGFLFAGLDLKPREVPSPLVGKVAPDFELPVLHQPDRLFKPADMKGKPWMLNVWASWCVVCRDEHPVLVALAKRDLIPILGLNYKDQPEDAKRWLKQFGDPYLFSVMDAEGRIGIDYGVYGVPETYLIDGAGVIRFKHIGVLTPEIVAGKILPLLKAMP